MSDDTWTTKYTHAPAPSDEKCIAELEKAVEVFTTTLNAVSGEKAELTKQLAALREVVPTLKKALLDISLCSQNSMASKSECGHIARAALDATSAAKAGGEVMREQDLNLAPQQWKDSAIKRGRQLRICRDDKLLLEQQLAALREAADRYSDNGHFPDCPVNDWDTGECECGLAELEPLLQEGGE